MMDAKTAAREHANEEGTMQEITLRSGKKELDVVVAVLSRTLETMLDKGEAVAVFEAVALARDPQHEIFGGPGGAMASRLRQLAIIGPDGRMHDSIRNVLLSMAQGDGLEMVFVSPVAAR